MSPGPSSPPGTAGGDAGRRALEGLVLAFTDASQAGLPLVRRGKP